VSTSPAALLLTLVLGCDEGHDDPQESRRIADVRQGTVQATVELERWGTHVAFGNGGGTGGMLDPAHSLLHLRAWIRLRIGDAAADVDLEYERFAREAVLFTTDWNTMEIEDGRARWNGAWRTTTAQTCALGGGRIALRALRPGDASPTWHVVVVEDDVWSETLFSVEADCPAVMRDLASRPPRK